MGIFKNILKKLGIGRDDEPAAQPTASATPEAPRAAPGAVPPIQAGQPTPASPRAAMAPVDVMAKLETMSASNPGLDWKHSIVDLLKLLGLDHDLAARKELAADLDYSGSDADGSAAKNMWLHKTVMQKLAENGGNIPQDMR